MKTLIIKLFVIVCCGEYSNGTYHYEAKSPKDSTTYSVYSTTKYNVGDTIQYTVR
jgi:hypothetical protein